MQTSMKKTFQYAFSLVMFLVVLFTTNIAIAHSPRDSTMICEMPVLADVSERLRSRAFRVDIKELAIYERKQGLWTPYCKDEGQQLLFQTEHVVHCKIKITKLELGWTYSDAIGTQWLEYLDFEMLEAGQEIVNGKQLGPLFYEIWPVKQKCTKI